MRNTVIAKGSADSRFWSSILVILKQIDQHVTHDWETNSNVRHLRLTYR